MVVQVEIQGRRMPLEVLKQSGPGQWSVILPGLGFPARDGRLSRNAVLSLPSSGNSSFFRRVMKFMAVLVQSPAGALQLYFGVHSLFRGFLHFSKGLHSSFFLEITFPTLPEHTWSHVDLQVPPGILQPFGGHWVSTSHESREQEDGKGRARSLQPPSCCPSSPEPSVSPLLRAHDPLSTLFQP